MRNGKGFAITPMNIECKLILFQNKIFGGKFELKALVWIQSLSNQNVLSLIYLAGPRLVLILGAGSAFGAIGIEQADADAYADPHLTQIDPAFFDAASLVDKIPTDAGHQIDSCSTRQKES